ncbi:MAG TPA: RNA ligase family protein [Methanosarcina sp.]|nr:RNA ligase family protein [Methanosarcina sp.]
MEKFGSIEQFKNVIKQVRDRAKWNGTPLPTLTFIGTCKLHGSNSAYNVAPDDSYVFQSRERELSIESDNAGFCMWGERNVDDLNKTIENVRNQTGTKDRIVVFAEWAGGSIQKGVALNQLPKMFVIFNITLIDAEGKRTELTPDQISSVVHRTDEIKCIYDFKTWKIDIDFNDPQAVQNQLVEWTLEVEKECPFGKAFGISGVGEGIVYVNWDTGLKFKVKGSEHSASKVKTLKEIAAVDIEKMNSIKELVNSAVSENRLNQGLDKLGEMGLEIDVKNTGAYIKWIVGDVMKEEKDVIVASGFDVKEIMPVVSEAAKKFWFETLNKHD